MKWLMIAAVSGIAGGLLLISDGGEKPTPDDLIGSSDAEYWQGYADLCQVLGELHPDGWSPAVVQKWNNELGSLRKRTHGEINERRSQAAANGKLVEFAEQIRKGNL